MLEHHSNPHQDQAYGNSIFRRLHESFPQASIESLNLIVLAFDLSCTNQSDIEVGTRIGYVTARMLVLVLSYQKAFCYEWYFKDPQGHSRLARDRVTGRRMSNATGISSPDGSAFACRLCPSDRLSARCFHFLVGASPNKVLAAVVAELVRWRQSIFRLAATRSGRYEFVASAHNFSIEIRRVGVPISATIMPLDSD